MSDRDAETVTLVLGAYRGTVVSVYTITGFDRNDEGRVRWEGSSADEFAGLIGQPLPGGDWKRGQARPLRPVQVTANPGNADDAAHKLMSGYHHDSAQHDKIEHLRQQARLTVVSPTSVTVRVPPGTTVLVHPLAPKGRSEHHHNPAPPVHRSATTDSAQTRNHDADQ
ncbi:MAG: hypothetical protein ACRC35_07930 [Angustibacter sp.]